MYNSEPADRVHQQQAALERLEALRMAAELRHRQILEFQDSNLSRFDYPNVDVTGIPQTNFQHEPLQRIESNNFRFSENRQNQNNLQHGSTDSSVHQSITNIQSVPSNARDMFCNEDQEQLKEIGPSGANHSGDSKNKNRDFSSSNEISSLIKEGNTDSSSSWSFIEGEHIKSEVNTTSDHEGTIELQSVIERVDASLLWNLANAKILNHFSLWNILEEKLRLESRKKSSTECEMSTKDKLNFLLREINSLIEEATKLLQGCCDILSEDFQDISESSKNDDELLTLTGPLSKTLSQDGSHAMTIFSIRSLDDMSLDYRNLFMHPVKNLPKENGLVKSSTKPCKLVEKVKMENSNYFNRLSGLDEDDDESSDDMDCPDDLSSDDDEKESLPICGEKSSKKSKPIYPSVNVPRKGDKERRKIKEQKKQDSESKDSNRKVRKDRIPGPPYVCQGCNATYSQRKTLRIHIKSGKCQGVPRPERPKHKVIKGRYFCLHPVCVPTNGELGDHVTSYTCAEQVWQHFAEKHQEQSMVVTCELCSKKFPSKPLVDLHFKLSHEPKFTCKYCGQPCMSKQKLQNHERRHTGEKPFACEFCDFKTNFKNSLNTHKARIHDKNIVKKHMCELCGKSFFTKTCLKEHIVTHTDAKRYSCEICGKLLRNDSSYRRHMMCVHGVKQTCEICGKDIYTKTGLDRHKKEAHGILP